MPNSRGKYTLDELLKAKRQEQPSPEFWASFERELKSKQRLLIQKQLVQETHRKSPTANYLFRFSTLSAGLGAAAFAIYLGFNTNEPTVDETTVAQNEAAIETPSFTVAAPAEHTKQVAAVSPSTGLAEFATLAQTPAPRVVVRKSIAPAKLPTESQLSAIETLAQLEREIEANKERFSGLTPVALDYKGVNELFEAAEVAINSEDGAEPSIWNFEQEYLLGKYANPLGRSGRIDSQSLRGPGAVQTVSFSQIDDVLSSTASRRSAGVDALTVRF